MTVNLGTSDPTQLLPTWELAVDRCECVCDEGSSYILFYNPLEIPPGPLDDWAVFPSGGIDFGPSSGASDALMFIHFKWVSSGGASRGSKRLLFRWLRVSQDAMSGEYTYSFGATVELRSIVSDDASEGNFATLDGDVVIQMPVLADGETGYWTITGMPGQSNGEAKGFQQKAKLRKQGIVAYRGEGTETTIYLRENVIDGGYPGCVSGGLPAREYSGHQRFMDGVVAGIAGGVDPSGAYENTFSKGLRQMGYESAPHADALLVPLRLPTRFGTVVNGTASRTMTENYSCDGVVQTHSLSLQLVDEYTTAMLEAAVQALLDLQPNDTSGDPPFLLPAQIGMHYMTPTQTYHERIESQVRLYPSLTGGLYLQNGDGISLFITCKKRTYNLASGGSPSESTLSFSASFIVTSDNTVSDGKGRAFDMTPATAGFAIDFTISPNTLVELVDFEGTVSDYVARDFVVEFYSPVF